MRGSNRLPQGHQVTLLTKVPHESIWPVKDIMDSTGTPVYVSGFQVEIKLLVSTSNPEITGNSGLIAE